MRAIRVIAAACVPLAACDDATRPEGGIEVILEAPITVTGVVSDSGTVLCSPVLVARAIGPARSEAEWLGGSVTFHDVSGEYALEQVLDAWGSSRIEAGERVESRFLPHVFGPAPAFDASFVFRYQDRESGEIRDTNAVGQRCTTP